MNISLHAKFQVRGVTVLAVQLFNKIKLKKTKNMKKHVSLYFPYVMLKIHLFLVSFVYFRQ